MSLTELFKVQASKFRKNSNSRIQKHIDQTENFFQARSKLSLYKYIYIFHIKELSSELFDFMSSFLPETNAFPFICHY
jgi:hypothetical protein